MDTAGVPSLISRLKESFRDSSGEIIFGMSDGTVSIFGLVAGMLAGAQSGSVILLAGTTAAVAATVSMMAGVYLDLESEQDEARVDAEQRASEIQRDPNHAVVEIIEVLERTGLSERSIVFIRADLSEDPMKIRALEDAFASEEEPASRKVSTFIHALWMGLADFVAAMTPVIPFALLPLEQAKIVCVAGTAILLLLLGIGRAKLGNRPLGRTVLETMAIATAAGIAGVIFGWLVS